MKKIFSIFLVLILICSLCSVSAAENYCELFEKELSCFAWVTEYGNESTPFSANTIAFVTSRQMDFTGRYNEDKSSEFDECYSFPKAEFEAMAKKLFDVKVDLTTANYSELVDVRYDAETSTYDVIAHPRGSSLHYSVYGYSQSGGVYTVYLQKVDGESGDGEYAKAKCKINGEYAKILSFETISELPDSSALITHDKDDPSLKPIGGIGNGNESSKPTSSTPVSSDVSSNNSSEQTDTTDHEVLLEQDDLFITANPGVLPSGTVVKADKISDKSKLEFLDDALKGMASNYAAYEITATSNNVQVQPNGIIYANFDIPKGFDLNKVVVVYISSDGKVELCKSSVNKAGNYVTAELTHLSTYAVIERSNEDIDGQDNNKNLGTIVIILIVVAVVLAAAGFLAWYFLYYKKRIK